MRSSKIAAVMLALIMTFTYIPFSAYADDAEAVSVQTTGTVSTSGEPVEWTDWSDNTSLPTSVGNYRLTADVTLAHTWATPDTGSKKTTFDLNGHSIHLEHQGGSIDDFAIKVSEGTELTIEDNSAAADGRIYASEANAITVAANAVLNLNSGNISASTKKDDYSNSGKGVVVGTQESDCNSVFNMYGGSVSNNDSTGVLVAGGTFNMTGSSSSITGNGKEAAGSWYGSGVRVANQGHFNISEGIIQNNTISSISSTHCGGGVECYQGTMHIVGKAGGTKTGKILITDNKRTDDAPGNVDVGNGTYDKDSQYIASCKIKVEASLSEDSRIGVWSWHKADYDSTNLKEIVLTDGLASFGSADNFFCDREYMDTGEEKYRFPCKLTVKNGELVVQEAFTLQFVPNGGEGSMKEAVVIAGSEFALPQNAFTKADGQVFDKWTTTQRVSLDLLDGKPGTKVTVEGAAKGEDAIKASWKDGTQVSDVTLSSTSLDLKVNETGQLTATVEPADADTKTLIWSSDNEMTAVVDDNGKVTALANGTAVITAKTVDGSGKEASCSVMVTEPEPSPSVDPGQAGNTVTEIYNAKLPKVSAKKPSRGKTYLKAKWSRLSKKNRKKVTNIEIQYARNKQFTDSVGSVMAGKAKASKKIPNLARKKTYYVRARAVRNEGNVKYVGKWSKTKKVKTK